MSLVYFMLIKNRSHSNVSAVYPGRIFHTALMESVRGLRFGGPALGSPISQRKDLF